jgi:hypothetical protein
MELIRLSITERAEYCLCMSLNTQNPSTISLLRETNPLWIKKSENLTHSCNMQAKRPVRVADLQQSLIFELSLAIQRVAAMATAARGSSGRRRQLVLQPGFRIFLAHGQERGFLTSGISVT